MKTRIVWLTAVSLTGFIGLSPCHAQPGVNLISNGDFETGTNAGWNFYGNMTYEAVTECVGAAVPEPVIQGQYCMHIVIPAAGAGPQDVGISRGEYTFEAGKKYTLSCFIKTKSGTLDFVIKPEQSGTYLGFNAQQFTATEKWKEFYTTTNVFTEDTAPASPTFWFALQAGDFWLDDIKMYEGDYVESEFSSVKARNPNPEDGARLQQTWASLSWTPGKAATSHDVYFGENYDDVLAGTGETFRGNQSSLYFIVGFPGFPFPEGLVYGATYYWRIDEVNDLHPDSPWAGDVWNFLVPSKSAYNPVPADGAKFIESDIELGWTSGFNAIMHYVYFGENFDDVDAGTGGTSKGVAGLPSFSPGALDQGKTYYWRIDEFDGSETHKGNIWSFTTASPGGGVRADYYKGMNFENFVLSRTDPQINFNWGDPGGPDPSVGNDNFSVRWTGEVEAAFTETYTFYPKTDDGVRLWVDGQLLVDNWVDRSVTEDNGKIDLIADNTYSLVMEYYENGGSAVAELRWSSPRTPKQLIPQAALALPVKASSPTPRSGSVDVKQTIVLSWGAGQDAASHEVYFGTDEDAVRNATKASPEFKGTKALGNETYDPGTLEWATTYYWRIDEINPANPDSPWTGSVWTFTTAGFAIVEDFEEYTDNDAAGEAIWQSWIDGFGVADNGAQVGYLLPPYAEQTTVHGGLQSMPLLYVNEASVTNSEASMTLTAPRDWTQVGVAELSLWSRGASSNAAEPLYVAISNTSGAPAVVANDDPSAATIDNWVEWRIPLQAFADQGINLSNVDKIAIGLGSKSGIASTGGSGTLYIDDIRLYRSTPEPEPQ